MGKLKRNGTRKTLIAASANQGETHMKSTSYTAIALAVGLSVTASNAMAAKACNIVGTYTDTLGSTIIFKTTKTGTAQNSVICASTYTLKVKKDTSKSIKVTGKATGCGNLTADFVPNYPTCTTATGTVKIVGLGTFNDTITKQNDAGSVEKQPAPSAMENGLR
jgi:hypothetical protein